MVGRLWCVEDDIFAGGRGAAVIDRIGGICDAGISDETGAAYSALCVGE